MKNQQTQTALQWEVNTQDAIICVYLVGVLTRDSLLPLYNQRNNIFAQFVAYPQINWDLSKITRVDSAGFALLCELLQQSRNISSQDNKAKDPQIRLVQPPSQLLTLADLFGLSTWLNLFLAK